MQESGRVRVLAAVDDLFFSARIEAVALAAGVPVRIVQEAHELEAALEANLPGLIILDLNSRACEPLDAIRRIKGNARLASIPILGFLSHVQEDLQQAAREAGCDSVMPRSQFSARLPQILKGAGQPC